MIKHRTQNAVVEQAEKRPFDMKSAVTRLRQAVKPYPKAAMFELAERGHDSVFALLVACVLSIRTRDETSLPTALRLFERAATPDEMSKLAEKEIDALIADCTFHQAKAHTIREIARRTQAEFNGLLPGDAEVLQTFHGVGPKCAHLVVGIACGQPLISVDIHVHRVTNRWGVVRTPTPEKTMAALETILPRRYWVEINALLVPFGKHVCTGVRPKCSTCPLLEMCQQVGVTTHR